jgi:hypothetical protein
VSIDDADAALQIIEAGRQRVFARLEEAVADQMQLHGGLDELDRATLDELLAAGVGDAGASLWRISLAEGAADHFGISVSDALQHPAIDAAEQLIGLPQVEPAPEYPAAVAPETPWTDPAPDPWAAPEPDAEPELYIPPGYEDDLATGDAEAAPGPAAVDTWGAPLDETPVAEPFVPDPEPFVPDAGPFIPDAGPFIPDAGPFIPDPEPFIPDAGPFIPDPEPVPEPTPEPVIPEPVIHETEAEPAPALPEPEPVAPPAPPTPAPVSPAAIAIPQALRIAAIHSSGIESLQAGDEDIELRLSEAGLDVIKRSSGIAIGRLDWGEITALEVQEPGKRGRRRRKTKNRSLQVDTSGGQAAFELVGLSDEETAEHLEPMLARLRASGALATTA